MRALPYVESELTFLGDVTGTPTNYFGIAPPPGVPAIYPGERHRVRIHDARGIARELGIEPNGLAFARHRDGVLPDFRDEQAIRTRYYPALERLVAEHTGARRVVVFDHTFRSSALTARTGDVDTAVTRVHNDYTPASGPERVREMLGRFAPDEDISAVMRGRYAIFNVWRPTNGAVEQMPLAVCDLSTMRATDFAPAVLKWPHRTGYVSAVRFSPAHRWWYFPAMDVDEALLFKCYDSRPADGAAWCGAHSAFADPTSPANARPRESVEARVIALFDHVAPASP
jgi:hypothetical protein